jgi:hypothetical protein
MELQIPSRSPVGVPGGRGDLPGKLPALPFAIRALLLRPVHAFSNTVGRTRRGNDARLAMNAARVRTKGGKCMRHSISVLALVLLSFVAVAWAEKVKLTASSVVPGAQDTVEAATDRSGNSALKLTVEHLSQPGSLTLPGQFTLFGCRGKVKMQRGSAPCE